MTPQAAGQVVRFGIFEVDLATGELQRKGLKVRLQEQPFQVLRMLLERPGELVRREDLRQRLWPAVLFAEFEPGLNKAVHKVRVALGDSADNPRFVETLAGRGYRFIATLEGSGRGADTPRDPARLARPAPFSVIWDGHAIPLSEGCNTIGREHDSTIYIRLASVSRRHARIHVSGETATLEDLGSKNGTLLNGQRIQLLSPLADGDEIRVGSARLLFEGGSSRRSKQDARGTQTS
jgi:DNA-binding winged helix-turn-helix (wHTH) protein